MTTRRVIVSNGHETFYGHMQWESPLDPPTVEANGRRLYAYAWRQQGWTVEDDTEDGT